MGLLNFLCKEYRIRFKALDYNGNSFIGKTTIQCFNTTQKDIEEKLKDIIYVETGKKIKQVTILGII